MGRTSRVPYHQNVYDLLQLEPGESPEAARMIAEHEAAHGPLPASLREWLLVPDVLPLVMPEGAWGWEVAPGTLWFDYSNEDQVLGIAEILRGFATPSEQPRGRFVSVIVENQAVVSWWVEVDGSEDPPVWCDNDQPEEPEQWEQVSPSFSGFVTDWITCFYQQPYTPRAPNSSDARADCAVPFVKPYANGLWLRTPADPFAPPVIDFLTEQLGEPEQTPRPGDITTYTFRPDGGTIRVTADEPSLPDGLSAWWIHAQTPERLAELGRLLLPWGTLRETLRADTEAARNVLRQIIGARPA